MSTPAVSDKNAPYFQAVVVGENLNHFKDFTNVSSDSAALARETTLVELFATQDCWVRVVPTTESDAAAAPAEGVKGASKFIPGGICAFIGINRVNGVDYKLAVIRNTVSGTLHITEGK